MRSDKRARQPLSYGCSFNQADILSFIRKKRALEPKSERPLKLHLRDSLALEVEARANLKRERNANRRPEARPIERSRLQEVSSRSGVGVAEAITKREVLRIEQVEEVHVSTDVVLLRDGEGLLQAQVNVEVTTAASSDDIARRIRDEAFALCVDINLLAAQRI